MSIVRIVSVSALTLLTTLQLVGTANADHRHRLRILWPKIFAPEISGYLYRDEDDDEDKGFFDPEDEDDYRIRNRRDRRVVLELYDDEDFEPRYEPPVKAKPIVKKASVKKPVVKSTPTTASIIKPKIKPTTMAKDSSQGSVSAKSSVAKTVITVPPAKGSATLPASASLVTAAAKPLDAKTAVPQGQLTSNASAAASIGCSKGAEIVSGYGFTSVKPRTCTGASYSFDASRGANGYLIKLSAATGEITDVTKLK